MKEAKLPEGVSVTHNDETASKDNWVINLWDNGGGEITVSYDDGMYCKVGVWAKDGNGYPNHPAASAMQLKLAFQARNVWPERIQEIFQTLDYMVQRKAPRDEE